MTIGPDVDAASGADPAEVSLGDIEARLRALSASAKETVLQSKKNTAVAGALAGIGTLAATYLFGRRRGRRRATIIEVERR
jgi:hypothetical protein